MPVLVEAFVDGATEPLLNDVDVVVVHDLKNMIEIQFNVRCSLSKVNPTKTVIKRLCHVQYDTSTCLSTKYREVSR